MQDVAKMQHHGLTRREIRRDARWQPWRDARAALTCQFRAVERVSSRGGREMRASRWKSVYLHAKHVMLIVVAGLIFLVNIVLSPFELARDGFHNWMNSPDQHRQ